MRRCADALALLLASLLGAVSACSSDRAVTVQVGRHELRLVPPRGWEHLDHGRVHLFRNGETELALTDVGPATTTALVEELREAEALWQAGRRLDAFARVRELDGPPLRILPGELRAEFWRPWYEATRAAETADDAAVAAAFRALIEAAGALPEATTDQQVAYLLADYSDTGRREIARRDLRMVHGADWTTFDTWDRVSHMSRRSYAYLESDGRILLLSAERGHESQTAPAFGELLATIERAPRR